MKKSQEIQDNRLLVKNPKSEASKISDSDASEENFVNTDEESMNQQGDDDDSKIELQVSEGDDQEPCTSKSLIKRQKKRKKGIIYVSNIPKYMNVTIMREILGQYAKIGRVYLQPDKISAQTVKVGKKKKRLARHFTEGWVEFESKRAAKKIVELLNNKQIGTRKRSKFYDSLWSMKYLPRFKWVHLTERMNYEAAVRKQKLMNEVSQARKEAAFFQNNLDKSELLKKKNKKSKNKVVNE